MQATQSRSRRGKILRVSLILLSLALVLAGLLLALHFWESRRNGSPEDGDDSYSSGSGREFIWYGGQKYALRKNMETLLLIGLDSYQTTEVPEGSTNEERSDFLMLLVIDRDAKTCTTLHIDRDTMAEVQILNAAGLVARKKTMQLALAHTYGSGGHDSCRNTVTAVSSFLYETPIKHYLSVTMEAVQILNDAVGGVTVTVMDDMTSIDKTLVQGAEVTLRGDLALKYVRARKSVSDGTNQHRMERQRQYMDALYLKLAERYASESGFGLQTLLQISEYMVSDCTSAQLSDLLEEASGYEFVGIGTIEGEAIVGENLMEFYPDEEKLQELILTLFYEPLDE